MQFGIKDKVALIGGSSRGIGRCCAEALLAEGARVAICARGEDALAETAERLRKHSGGEVIAVPADLSRSEDVAKVLQETRSRLGEIEILVTNTGGPKPGRFTDLEEEQWDGAYDLLFKSALRLIWGVLPGMRERKWGRIIGITSVSVKEPIDNLILSNVFRSGVTALFKTLAREVARDGITVNTLLPGLTDTDRLREVYGAQATAKGVSTDQIMAKIAGTLPQRRMTRPEELGQAAAFLASEAASGITGSALAIDGGQLRGLT